MMPCRPPRPRPVALVVLLAVLVGACASTRGDRPPEPDGIWNYVVEDTPYGTVRGSIVIDEDDGALSGEMFVDAVLETVALEDVRVERGRLQFRFTLPVEGASAPGTLSAALSHDALDGVIEVEGVGRFPLRAQRSRG